MAPTTCGVVFFKGRIRVRPPKVDSIRQSVRFGSYHCSRRVLRTGHPQDGIPSTKWILHRFFGLRVWNPSPVHHETIFVLTGLQRCFLPPFSGSICMQSLCLRLPVVEGTRHTNRMGGCIRKLKTYRYQRGGFVSIGVIVVVFHNIFFLNFVRSFFPWMLFFVP